MSQLQRRRSDGSQSQRMQVVKRDGRREDVSLDKITKRVEFFCKGLDRDFVDPTIITLNVVKGICDGITTRELDEFAANYASTLAAEHPDFAILAGRIAISNLQKQTSDLFSEAMKQLYMNVDPKNGEKKSLLAEDVYEIVKNNKERLNKAIDHKRDFGYSYFGFRTLERAYLMQVNGKIVERPQYMIMRVAIGIHKEDIDSAIETYNLMSERWFTHATPTLFNAGRPKPQLSSCYLLTIADDSIEGIYDTLKQCALISKYGGGIGMNVHCIRGAGSEIDGRPGVGTGLLPMLKNFNATATYVNQGGKRPGAFSVYLEPWHSDIFEFVQLRLNVGPEEQRCRDLFLALWIPDLFMKRVEADAHWTLMSPDECPGLVDSWGEEFEALYEKYESEGKFRKQIKARDLWRTIISSQCETGLPYMLYKDSCNRKSNQQNLGTIKCSNLCTEIVQYSSKDEVAVCNLASIALNRFVKEDKTFDFEQLRYIAGVVTKNLNKVIEVNFYPISEAHTSNMLHRPIGIGVQGLADVFILMRYSFTSPEARDLNKKIFETIYYGALSASVDLAEKLGPYRTYEGSPISKGILQFDMWEGAKTSGLWNWQQLRERIAKFGVRNSLLIAPMPTASTAQILGNNEAFEPYTSNMYTRRVAKGDFQVVNPHLIRDLIALNLWNDETREQLIHSNGSVQNLEGLSSELKEIYRTVWEVKQLDLIEMAADRGAFIDQSQSLNLFVESPNYVKCTTMHFRSWKLGLKTGMYYLRSKSSVNPVKFSVKRKADQSLVREIENEASTPKSSRRISSQHISQVKEEEDDGEGCLMCGS